MKFLNGIIAFALTFVIVITILEGIFKDMPHESIGEATINLVTTVLSFLAFMGSYRATK